MEDNCGDAESKFAAVIFHNIQEAYIPGKDIRCCYSVKSFVVPTANDWIGLYKVGWKSYRDYLCYEYSPVTEGDEEKNNDSLSSQKSVVFNGDNLPQEEAEFYQFCYVTSIGEIRGASYPFLIQYSIPGELECSEELDDSGDAFLVVRNKTTILEDSLAKAYEENAMLKSAKETHQADCLHFQDMILELENQKILLETSLHDEKKMKSEVMKEKILVEEKLNDYVIKVKDSEKLIKDNEIQTLELQKAVDIERHRSKQTSEDQKKLEADRVQIWENLLECKKEVKQLKNSLEEANLQMISFEEKSMKVKQENDALSKEHEKLMCQLNDAQVSLDESKQSNLSLERSIADHIENIRLLQKENAKLQQELACKEKEIVDFDEVHKTDVNKIVELQEQHEVLMKKLEEKDIALSEAVEKMQESIVEINEKEASHQVQVEQYESTIQNIQDQLVQERAFNNSLSSASDKQVAELQELLNFQLEKNATVVQEMDSKMREFIQLEEKMEEKDAVILELQKAVSKGEQDLQSAKEQESLLLSVAEEHSKEETKSDVKGPYFALQTAHVQLKKHYLQNKKEMENLVKQKSELRRQLNTFMCDLSDDDLRIQMASMKKRNDELRSRLNMGAEEYKIKFKECRRVQNQLKKLQGCKTSQSCGSQDETVQETSGRSTDSRSSSECEESNQVDVGELEQAKSEIVMLTYKLNSANEFIAKAKAEKEQRLVEDQQLESYMANLRQELESKRKSEAASNQQMSDLTNENQNLKALLSENDKDSDTEKNVLKEEVIKLKKLVEDLNTELLGHKNCNEFDVLGANEQQNPELSTQQNVCPVCSIYYPPNCPQDKFETHVQSHFRD